MKNEYEPTSPQKSVLHMKDWAPFGPVVLGGLSYMLCSSFMLIISKVAVNNMPMVALGASVQLAVSVVAVLVLKASKLTYVGTLSTKSALDFLPYGLAFAACLYANGRALYHTNVETIIVGRACAPLLIGIMDGLLGGRDLPYLRSIVAAALVVGGAAGYMHFDRSFQEHGHIAHFWAFLLVLTATAELWSGRTLVLSGHSDYTSVYSSYAAVFYTNIVGLPLLLALAAFSGEFTSLYTANLKPAFIFMPLVSAFLGFYACVSMWEFRGKVQPTTFSLLTYACNLLAIVVNVTMLNDKATVLALAFIIVCLAGGTLFHADTFYDADAHASSSRDYAAHKAAAAKWRGYKRKITAPPSEQGPNYWQNRICIAFTVFLLLLVVACSMAFGSGNSLSWLLNHPAGNSTAGVSGTASHNRDTTPMMRHHRPDLNEHTVSHGGRANQKGKLSVAVSPGGLETK